MARMPVLTTTAPAATSGFKHLSTTLLGSPAASISITGLSTSNLMFRLTMNVRPVTDSTNLLLRLNNDSGANYGYFTAYQNAGAVAGFSAAAQTSIRINDTIQTMDNGAMRSLYVAVFGKATAGTRGVMSSHGLLIATASETVTNLGAAEWTNVADLISRFDILMSSGNLATGTYMRIEGLIP